MYIQTHTHTHCAVVVPLCVSCSVCFCRMCSWSLARARRRSPSLQGPKQLASLHFKPFTLSLSLSFLSVCRSFVSLFPSLCLFLSSSCSLSVCPFRLFVSGLLSKVWPHTPAVTLPPGTPVTPPTHTAELSLHRSPSSAAGSSSHDLRPHAPPSSGQ